MPVVYSAAIAMDGGEKGAHVNLESLLVKRIMAGQRELCVGFVFDDGKKSYVCGLTIMIKTRRSVRELLEQTENIYE